MGIKEEQAQLAAPNSCAPELLNDCQLTLACFMGLSALPTYNKLAAIYSLGDSAWLECIDLIRWYKIGRQYPHCVEVHNQESITYLQR